MLYLPQNESVYFNMVSRDVIHAFWIPAFRLQEDVVPGITTHYRATPTRLGTYRVVCNLLCGIGHSLDAGDRRRPAPGAVRPLARGEAGHGQLARPPRTAASAGGSNVAAASAGNTNVTSFVAGGGG